jgi:3-deoxy-D-manno-octulosonic-acid transferase
MPRTLVYLLYNLLLPPLLLLGLPTFLIKGLRRGGLCRGFTQRLGFFSPAILARFRGRKPLWIHAVSVGEVFLALKLIEAIRVTSPGRTIVLSTTTTTGHRVAAGKEDETLTVIHNPVDLPWIARQVLRTIDPCALVLVESEIWPNLVGLAKRRGLPVLLVNARLSPRSERRYGKVRPLITPVFSLLDGVTVPFDDDVIRWSSLGIDPARIHVTGSVKFDNAGPAAATQCDELAAWLLSTGMPRERKILLGGSTHEGEELLLARTARDLRREFPGLQLVLVPRHAERGPEIASRLREDGFDPVLRVTSGTGAPVDADATTEPRVWIANTTGELRGWYALADLVMVGKSFHGTGGQNPVEPILAGRPVVVGPHMENFAEVVAELRGLGGLRQLDGEAALFPALREFLLDPAAGKAMAERGATAMARHTGSAMRNAEWIRRAVPPGGADPSSPPLQTRALET